MARLNEQLAYGYDAAGNLAFRTNNALAQNFMVNSLNELTTNTNGGTLAVVGSTASPSIFSNRRNVEKRKVSMLTMKCSQTRILVQRAQIIPLLSAVLTLSGCSDNNSGAKSVSRILDQLDPAKSQLDHIQAAVSLQDLGTNALPFLVAEMNSFKWRIPEEKDQRVIARTQRLRAAFEILGTNLAPCIQDFVANLNTNQNFMSALDGLAATHALGAVYVVAALTNREAPIRLNAAAVITKIGTNAEIARMATPNLFLLLKDKSPLIRSIAIEALGLYCDQPTAAIAALIRVADEDTDPVIRSQAVKAVGRIQTRFGPMDSKTRSALEEISRNDGSQVVKTCAERVLRVRNLEKRM